MKKIISLIFFLFLVTNMFSQSQGISYQAVVIDKNPEELPGVDIQGNYLPDKELAIRFSILNQFNGIDYQEEHQTKTDEYGMIHLVIGWGNPTTLSPGVFSDIDWEGQVKMLRVEINLDLSQWEFEDFSIDTLNFVPYAYHRNITATGSMIIDGESTLQSDLTVNARASITETVDIGDSLTVLGSANVAGITRLNDQLQVEGISQLNNAVNVAGTSLFSGQMTISPNLSGNDNEKASYPLIIEGSNQGIAINVNSSRSNSNNYISFWDNSGIQGRIEGQTVDELNSSPEYIVQTTLLSTGIVTSSIDLGISIAEEVQAVIDLTAASTSANACAGVGAVACPPVPSLIPAAIVNLVLKTANLVSAGINEAAAITDLTTYEVFAKSNIGITYESGAGDYAEWLPKASQSINFQPGDIVGVKGGSIGYETAGAENQMVISTTPIVLGNMPPKNEEHLYEKVAFMGQVPVKVLGKVSKGDYILPSRQNNGFGIAVKPENLKAADFKNIVGIAWSESKNEVFNLILVAVGINANDIAILVEKQQAQIDKQDAEIRDLKARLERIEKALLGAEPQNIKVTACAENILEQPRTVYLYRLTEKQLNEGIELAKQKLAENGIDVKNHPFFSQIESDATFKEKYIQKMQSSVDKEIQAKKIKEEKAGNTVIVQ
jgi:hypothetical protein